PVLFHHPRSTAHFTLSLHDALPISTSPTKAVAPTTSPAWSPMSCRRASNPPRVGGPDDRGNTPWSPGASLTASIVGLHGLGCVSAGWVNGGYHGARDDGPPSEEFDARNLVLVPPRCR